MEIRKKRIFLLILFLAIVVAASLIIDAALPHKVHEPDKIGLHNPVVDMVQRAIRMALIMEERIL